MKRYEIDLVKIITLCWASNITKQECLELCAQGIIKSNEDGNNSGFLLRAQSTTAQKIREIVDTIYGDEN